jgi:hypothetical protein
LTGIIGTGPAASATNLIPDLDHFRGSFGAKHVIPLWRDGEATIPNVVPGLLESLELTPEELFAYCYALLSAPSYTTRFAPAGMKAGEVPQGSARAEVAVPSTQEGYPQGHSYEPESLKLRVGEGIFGPVPPEVRGYSVSGLDVIGSWLDYRMLGGAGRRSSQLDRIRPAIWPAAFSEELLRLLWVIEATVSLGPDLDNLLKNIVVGPVYRADELPEPTPESRLPPG